MGQLEDLEKSLELLCVSLQHIRPWPLLTGLREQQHPMWGVGQELLGAGCRAWWERGGGRMRLCQMLSYPPPGYSGYSPWELEACPLLKFCTLFFFWTRFWMFHPSEMII